MKALLLQQLQKTIALLGGGSLGLELASSDSPVTNIQAKLLSDQYFVFRNGLDW